MEYDLDGAQWVKPAGHCKNGREHRLPLLKLR